MPPPPEVEIRRESVLSATAARLIGALNAELLERYPEDGTPDHFRLDPHEVAEGRGAFLIATMRGAPVGCGAIRRLDADTAEIKRMYVESGSRGRNLGQSLLAALEAEARRLGIARLVLETGSRQPEAVALYRHAGFVPAAAFGEYHEHPLSTFLGKVL